MNIVQEINIFVRGAFGQQEVYGVFGTDTGETIVARQPDGTEVWRHQGPIDGWNRGPKDRFLITADLDGDGAEEILIANGAGLWTGVMKWDDTAKVLHVPWMKEGWIDGWNRGPKDVFLAHADLEGDGTEEIVIANGAGRWTGVMKWDVAAGVLHVPWMKEGWIDAWNRGPADVFDVVGDIDNDGRTEIVIHNPNDLFVGVIKWTDQLHVPWLTRTPITGPAGDWNCTNSDGYGPAFFQGRNAVAAVAEEGQKAATLEWQVDKLVVVQLGPGGNAEPRLPDRETAEQAT